MSEKRLLIREMNPLEKDIRHNIQYIENKIISIFKYRVGKENSISSYEIFNQVFGIEPYRLTVFERAYLWNVVKSILTKLRSSMVLFVVNNGTDFYVLKTKDEYKIYESKVNNMIDSLNETKRRARKWVHLKMYLSDNKRLQLK